MPSSSTSRRRSSARRCCACGQPLRKKLVTVVLDTPTHYVWRRRHSPSRTSRPASSRRRLGFQGRARCVGLGYLRGPAAHAHHAGTPLTVDLGQAVPATGLGTTGRRRPDAGASGAQRGPDDDRLPGADRPDRTPPSPQGRSRLVCAALLAWAPAAWATVDVDALWDFGRPAVSEERFRARLAVTWDGTTR